MNPQEAGQWRKPFAEPMDGGDAMVQLSETTRNSLVVGAIEGFLGQ